MRKEPSFKTIQFLIKLEGRNADQKRTDKKEAIGLAQRTAKKYPGKIVRVVQIIEEYSEVDF